MSGQKFIKNAKIVNLASFWKPEIFGDTVLPNRSILIRQKLVENAKIGKLVCDILGDFKTLWVNLELKWTNHFRLKSNVPDVAIINSNFLFPIKTIFWEDAKTGDPSLKPTS